MKHILKGAKYKFIFYHHAEIHIHQMDNHCGTYRVVQSHF